MFRVALVLACLATCACAGLRTGELPALQAPDAACTAPGDAAYREAHRVTLTATTVRVGQAERDRAGEQTGVRAMTARNGYSEELWRYLGTHPEAARQSSPEPWNTLYLAGARVVPMAMAMMGAMVAMQWTVLVIGLVAHRRGELLMPALVVNGLLFASSAVVLAPLLMMTAGALAAMVGGGMLRVQEQRAVAAFNRGLEEHCTVPALPPPPPPAAATQTPPPQNPPPLPTTPTPTPTLPLPVAPAP